MRVSYITLAVADVGRSTAFYRAFLQVEPDRIAARHAFFEADGQTLALFDREGMAAETGAAGQPGAVALSWNLPDAAAVVAARDRAVAAGAQATRAVHAKPWGGVACWVTDPDGHPWELVWNPKRDPAP